MATTTRVSCGRPSRSRLLSIESFPARIGATPIDKSDSRRRGRARAASPYYRDSAARIARAPNRRRDRASLLRRTADRPAAGLAKLRCPTIKPLQRKMLFATARAAASAGRCSRAHAPARAASGHSRHAGSAVDPIRASSIALPPSTDWNALRHPAGPPGLAARRQGIRNVCGPPSVVSQLQRYRI